MNDKQHPLFCCISCDANKLYILLQKLARMTSKEAVPQHATAKSVQQEGRPRGGRRRTNSCNDPSSRTPDIQGSPRGNGKYKHAHKDLYNGSNNKMLKNLPNQHERGRLQPDKYIDFPLDRSLSGSFLSLESPPKSFPSSPEYLNVSMTEGMFDGHFKSPRSLSNSKLIFEFPSPMHAILLHFDKTEEPVLDKNKLENAAVSPDSKSAQSSPTSCAVDRQISYKTNNHNKFYKMRKDSTIGETAIDFSHIHSMQKEKSESRKDSAVVDDGVSAFIEMLANRGLAKRKREGKAKQLPRARDKNFCLQSGLDRSSDKNSTMSISNQVTDRDTDMPHGYLKLTDDYIGSWDGSCLSSSGKRGSHISVRSSASSKASLSSEEGYYSHPSSPKNKRDNERLCKQASISTVSIGSSLLQSDNAEVSDDPLIGVSDAENDGKVVREGDNEKMEILSLPDSPGARRRRSGINSQIGESAGLLTLSSESLRVPKESVSLTCYSAPNSPRKALGGNSQFSFTTDSGKRSKSAEMVPVAAMTDISQPRFPKSTPKSARVPKSSPEFLLAQRECKNASPSREERLPNGNNTTMWFKNGLQQDGTPIFQRVHCFESPKTPTIKEEPRKEARERDVAKGLSSRLNLVIPSDPDHGGLQSPPICQAPKVPSWRLKNKTQVNEPVTKVPDVVNETARTNPDTTKNVPEENNVNKGSKSVKPMLHNQDLEMTETKDGNVPSQRGHSGHLKRKNPGSSIKLNDPKAYNRFHKTSGSEVVINEKRKQTNVEINLPVTPKSKTEESQFIFECPPQFQRNLSAPPVTPTRKDIPEILKSWVESKKPTLTPEQKTKQAVHHSKSLSLPVPIGPQPLTPTPSVRPSQEFREMLLGNSKRFFKSQESLTKDLKTLGERHCPTPGRNSKDLPSRGVALSLRNHKPINVSNSPKPLKAKMDIVNTHVSCDDQNMNKTSVAIKHLNAPNAVDGAPRARSSSWSKGHCPSVSPKNAWVREIVVPCNSPPSKLGTSRARSASFNVNTNKGTKQGSGKSRMMWYNGRNEINDTFV